MYCKTCKSFFPEEKIVHTPMERETGYSEDQCPICGSTWIEESYTCLNCGEDITERVVDLCDDCMKDFKRSLENLKENYGFKDDMEFLDALVYVTN